MLPSKNEVKDKKSYVATITFQYDGDEPLPLSDKKITHLDDIIEQVRFELVELSPSEFIIEATEYINGEPSYKITG